ncbi:anaerobic ribonucleoside triphosphate reductase [candidate division SR1 bacterium]|nr:anaerobic ribonucleoside triphosphate reductase [candidate division SR1 bacterium]
MSIQTVIKRDGSSVPYDANKIKVAIQKANKEVAQNDRASDATINWIILELEALNQSTLAIEGIQDFIESKLMQTGKYHLAKAYVVYRYNHALLRRQNSTDESILALVKTENKAVGEENSNKNPRLLATQRDLIAGEVSKDISARILLPEHLIAAHNNGEIHFHDMDYYIQDMFNCCLVNLKDMFENGTVMNDKFITEPKSFTVACTVMTQIIAANCGGQYGGQSVNIKHLGKYLKVTEDKEKKKLIEQFGDRLSQDLLTDLVEKKVTDNLKTGVQTIQYQLNTFMTTNGQSPFVTLFLHLDPEDEYVEYTARIIEEIFRQRIQGIQNEQGIWVTPAFPKLVYVIEERNSLSGGKYDHITKLAAECSAKRMYPDYISAKKMRENYEGNVFSPMGCRSFLSPRKDEKGEYKFEGRFNQGVVSLNLPQIGILASQSPDPESAFFEILNERLDLCFEALMIRHKKLKGVKSDVSPLHRQYGGLARLQKGETIDKLLEGGYSTISLGYIGVYEATKLVKGVSHTDPIGMDFAIKLMQTLRAATDGWKKETGIGFGLYGTPAESLCYRFAKIDKARFGDIEDVTDKGFYTNSYHTDVRENIDAFTKLTFESQFQKISSGGAISYIEVPNMQNNVEALETLIKFIYDNIQYAEFNTKSDYCHECSFSGEIQINDQGERECPQCHNTNQRKMNVVRRTCGYLGEKFRNVGKTKEIKQRVLHL